MARRKKGTGSWRRRFLRGMARTANARLSAEMAGVDHSTAYQLRERDAVFAAAWVRARDWGRTRAKAAGRPAFAAGRPRPQGNRGALDPRPFKMRPRRDGGAEIVCCGEGRQSPQTDDIFFMHLAAGHGIRRSAAAAGFSTTALYNRRMLDPAFAARWELAKAQGVARNEMLLIDCVPNTLDPETSEGADDLPRPSIAEAIRIVRMTQVAAGGRNAAEPDVPERSAEEMIEQLRARIEEIELEETQEKIEAGWVEDEEGNWIPPGWARTG